MFTKTSWKNTSRYPKVKREYGIVVTNFQELCLYSDVVIPKMFKMLEFTKYDVKGCPYIHLKFYYDDMFHYGRNRKLLMQ